jgi:hypothetical protein
MIFLQPEQDLSPTIGSELQRQYFNTYFKELKED